MVLGLPRTSKNNMYITSLNFHKNDLGTRWPAQSRIWHRAKRKVGRVARHPLFEVALNHVKKTFRQAGKMVVSWHHGFMVLFHGTMIPHHGTTVPYNGHGTIPCHHGTIPWDSRDCFFWSCIDQEDALLHDAVAAMKHVSRCIHISP